MLIYKSFLETLNKNEIFKRISTEKKYYFMELDLFDKEWLKENATYPNHIEVLGKIHPRNRERCFEKGKHYMKIDYRYGFYILEDWWDTRRFIECHDKLIRYIRSQFSSISEIRVHDDFVYKEKDKEISDLRKLCKQCSTETV